jgi:hypothetical protein
MSIGFILCILHTVPVKINSCQDVINWWTPWDSPSWEAVSRSAGQEIPYLLWNPKICYHEVWRVLMTVCYNLQKYFFFYFVHCIYFNKITTFWKLHLLPSSGKKGRTETLAVGTPGWTSLSPGLRLAQPGGPNSLRPGLRLAHPGGPTAMVSVLPFLPEDIERSSFWNVVILLKYRWWTKSKKKPLLQICYRVHKSLPLYPVLSHLNPLHILCKLHFNIIFTPMPRHNHNMSVHYTNNVWKPGFQNKFETANKKKAETQDMTC